MQDDPQPPMPNYQPLPAAPSPPTRPMYLIPAVAVIIVIVMIAAAWAISSAMAPSNEQVKIQVQYSGQWVGSYGDVGDIRTWGGQGSETTTFTRSSTSDDYAVVAVAQKMDGGSGTMTVKILSMGGKVLKESSTSMQYGMVSITWIP